MKKFLFYVFPLFLLFSCNRSISDSDLKHINGYWEIVKAEMPDGEIKEYTVNTVVDYFEVSNKEGFRQKMIPQIDGDFLTNNLKENIQILNQDGVVILKYNTEFADWQEELISISEKEMIIKNEHDIKYFYKRFNAPLK